MTETLPNIAISVDLILNIVEGCAHSERPLTLEELAEYAECTVRAAREAVKAAIWLGFIEEREKKHTAAPGIRAQYPTTNQQRLLLFREHIQKKKAFVQFAALLASGNDAQAATRKVRVLYQIGTSIETITQLFAGWGKAAGILTDEKGTLGIRPEYKVPDLPLEYLEGIKEALESDFKARIFITRKLTEDPFRMIPDAGIDRAVKALRGISSDPRNAVEDAGELFEDYLRAKASADGLDTSDANGIGGVIQVLDANANLTGEHKTISTSVNTLRIMAAHPLRASTGLRWSIRQDSGLETVLLTMSLIRSIHQFGLSRQTVF